MGMRRTGWVKDNPPKQFNRSIVKNRITHHFQFNTTVSIILRLDS